MKEGREAGREGAIAREGGGRKEGRKEGRKKGGRKEGRKER